MKSLGSCPRSSQENSSPSLATPIGSIDASALTAALKFSYCWYMSTKLDYEAENKELTSSFLDPLPLLGGYLAQQRGSITWGWHVGDCLTFEPGKSPPICGPSGSEVHWTTPSPLLPPHFHLHSTVILRLSYIRIFNIFSSKCSSLVNI